MVLRAVRYVEEATKETTFLLLLSREVLALPGANVPQNSLKSRVTPPVDSLSGAISK